MHLSLDETVSHTRSHWWWRPGWSVGLRMYTMHLTLQAAPSIRELGREVREALESIPQMGGVPDEGLHLTMTGVGFTGEVDDAQLAEVGDRVFARATELATAPLVVEELFVGYEGVLGQVRQDPWLMDLSEIQRAAVDEVIGPVERGPFRPHVSFAYACGEVALTDVAAVLAPLAARTPGTVSGAAVHTLMRLGRDERVYAWDVVREQRLGG